MSVNAVNVDTNVPLKLTVTVSPTTAVVILVPPATVNVSVVVFAVVEPLSPATVANKFCVDPEVP